MASINGSYYPDTSTAASLETELANMAEAEDARFADITVSSAIKTYRPANAAALAALTAMLVGDIALQTDTAITYRYDGSAWKAWDSDWITDTMTTSIAVGTTGVKVLKHKFSQGEALIKGSITLGGTGIVIGVNATINLPVTTETVLSPYFTYPGFGNAYDSSVPANFAITVNANNTSTTVAGLSTFTSATGARGGVGGGVPLPWATGDVLSFAFSVTPA